MISSLVYCEARADGHVPIANGYLLFSALSQRLLSDGVSEILHEGASASPRKALSLSALMPEKFWRTFHVSFGDGLFHFRRGDLYAFRVSFWEDEFLELFARAVLNQDLSLGGAPFRVKRVSAPGENDMSRSASAPSLRGCQPSGGVSVTFLSPTGFKSGETQRILPEPALFFNSLAMRWRSFFNDILLERLPEKLFVADFSLKSVAMELKKGLVFRGCLGRARYDWKNEQKDVRQALACLASFSFFCGVGYKTLQGMGQVRVDF